MSFNEVAIRTTNLSKCYNIYDKPIDRLKQSIIPKVFKLLRGPRRTYYREFWALKDLNIEVVRGETLGVIGRNGSGKSTLLQLICRTLTPTTGHIEANGRIAALLELGTGFNPEFNGRDNIFLNGAILGLSKDEIDARFDAIVDFADIGEFLEQPVKFYSSGMVVRLAFAVQAMVDPDIFVVDEALAVGDELFQRKCFRRLETLKKNGTTILFVSHSTHQIIELCDRALLLDQGRRLMMTDPITTVKAYHKLLYAPQESRSNIVEKLMMVDQSQDSIDQLKAHPQNENTYSLTSPEYSQKIPDSDFFDANIKPLSKQIYPIQGAVIQSIKIYNEENEEVNNLLPRKVYKFEIQGEFYEEHESVHFLFYIGRISGPALISLAYPGINQYIGKVFLGQKFTLIHKIKMDLTPGTYFVTVSINSTNEPTCLHKIEDVIIFRVLEQAEKWAFGYTDLTVGKPEFTLSIESS